MPTYKIYAGHYLDSQREKYEGEIDFPSEESAFEAAREIALEKRENASCYLRMSYLKDAAKVVFNKSLEELSKEELEETIEYFNQVVEEDIDYWAEECDPQENREREEDIHE